MVFSICSDIQNVTSEIEPFGLRIIDWNLEMFASMWFSLYWSFLALSSTWWRHQMGAFAALLALCAGNSPVPVNSPHNGQWRGVLMFSLICVWINDCVNNREAGDLRRHRGHYDVNVMNFHINIKRLGCLRSCTRNKHHLQCISNH